MTKRIYDLDASAERVESARRAVFAQQQHILTLSKNDLTIANKKLRILEDMLEISVKTHSMIVEFVVAREAVEVSD